MWKNWIEAARPRTLLVSISPVLAASAYAWHDGVFKTGPAVVCLLFALLAQIASNFANDYYDHKKGADAPDRDGPRRAVAAGDIAPRTMLKATLFTLFLACALGCTLIYYAGWWLILPGVLIAVFALAYSAGPYPLSYHGLGDFAVFVFFGLAAVNLTYYVQAHHFDTQVFLASIAIGLLAVNVLLVNNYRDVNPDRAAGKHTTVVLFGTRFGRYFYLVNGLVAPVLTLPVWLKPGLLMGLFIPLLFILLHLSTWRALCRLTGKALNAVLGNTARNLFIFTLLLGLMLLIYAGR